MWVAAYDGALHHYDGNTWEKAATITGAHWLGLWGSRADDIWAFGVGGVLSHYDGKTWSLVEFPTASTLWGAWGSRADDVWFVGKSEAGGLRVHWDGTALK